MEKKKVATMTWIHNYNYGSVLQAYALQKVLIDNNYDTKIIDYNPSKLVKIFNLFKSHNSVKLFYYKLKSFISKRNSKISGHDSLGKEIKFQEFINSMLLKTEEISNPRKLKSLSGQYEAYICGSDQIWNPDLLNPPYYFSFLKDTDKKISYSPSFGVKSINNNTKKEIIKEYLKSFSHISVREEQGANIIKQMDIRTDEIPVVLDPTLLLSKNNWNTIVGNQKKEEQYLLCYFLKENDKYWESAKKIANKMNLKIKIIPNSEDSYNQSDEIIDNVGPIEWIKLIKSAKFVLTDSFHGILFSLIFNVSFYAYKRFSDNSVESQNSRVENILKKVNLEERLYEDNEIIEDVKIIESFEYVENVIEQEREKSIKYLINAIDN